MAKAEKYLIPNMPLASAMGTVTGYKRKHTPEYNYTVVEGAEFPVISFTSAKGALVLISFVPEVIAPVAAEGEEQQPNVDAYFVININGVEFKTSEKHCPGKVKTATRQAVNNLLRAVGKFVRKSERSEAGAQTVAKRAEQKTAAALL